MAPDDIFQKNEDHDDWEDKEDLDNGTDAPSTLRSAREERIYLGRGFNRLGLKKSRLAQ